MELHAKGLQGADVGASEARDKDSSRGFLTRINTQGVDTVQGFPSRSKPEDWMGFWTRCPRPWARRGKAR